MEYYKVFKSAWMEGLNPYYNGRYSWRAKKGCGRSKSGRVLILIIMEDTHGGCLQA